MFYVKLNIMYYVTPRHVYAKKLIIESLLCNFTAAGKRTKNSVIFLSQL